MKIRQRFLSGSRAYSAGFTLIEVLITTAIISIITAVSLVFVGNLREQGAVDGVSRQVAAAIRETQNYALTGRNIRAVGEVPCLFRFRTEAPDIFRIEQSNSVSGTPCGTDWDGETIAVGNGVEISVSEVRFAVPRAEPLTSSGDELEGSVFIDFTISRGGTERHVCVYPMGRVEEHYDACPAP